ncbi:alpha/beta fold hydrolase [Marmoricola sp. URHB0036]|uniref:alpha/beta fold hydrolase n=1 Tax=Marmoricola sp. URHB0036 TaxID=1298863 RepID=UPI000684EAF8|nr:alpha/beta fold hydrolase [Marmoricola sp. URHB0036]
MNSPLGSFLLPTGFDSPAGLRALAREASTVVEAGRLIRRTRADRRARALLPYAGTHKITAHDPVLLVPGFMAGDATLKAMALFLRHQGFRTYRSQIHVNAGCTREAADRLERRIETIAIRRNCKVTIVGHSLGGMLARGLASRRPDLIEGIVSMGSPVLAPGAVHKVLAWDAEMLARLTRAGFRGMMSSDCFGGECARLSFEESKLPIDPDLAFTAIYSKRDGIVDWRACLDPAAEHVEVRTSHVGMAVDPVVMDHVLTALRAQQFRRASRQEDPADEVGSLRVART